MIWKIEPSLDGINTLSKNTLVGHLGIVFTEFGDDYLKATMPVNEYTKQPYGVLHGGASVVLAETMGSYASSMCIDDPFTTPGFGIEINANHLKSARSGIVTGIVKPIRIGRSLHVWEIKIYDEKEDIICISRLTVMVKRK